MDNIKPKRRITPLKFILIVYDVSATVIAAYLSLLIIYEGIISPIAINIFKQSWYLYPIVGFITFYLAGFFDQMWAFASLTQYIMVGAGALVQTVAMVLILQFMELRFAYVVYVLYWFILTIMLLFIRILIRWYRSIEVRKKQKNLLMKKPKMF